MIKGLGVLFSLLLVAVGGSVAVHKGSLGVSSITPTSQVAQVSGATTSGGPFKVGSYVRVVTPIAVRTSPTSAATPTNKFGAEAVGATGIIGTGSGYSNPTSADGVTWWYVNYDVPASGCTVTSTQTCKSGWSTEPYLATYTPVDSQSPTVTAFSIPSTSSSLIVPISSLSATDNVAVTAYFISESATAPLASASGWYGFPPSVYTFASQGTKTLYAWAKDAAGNVSASASASVTVTTVVSNYKFNIGDKVSVNTTIAVRTSPTSSVVPTNKFGAEAVNMTGTIAVGSGYSNPTTADGLTWWYVNYDAPASGCTVTSAQTCKSGWSTESYLSATTTSGTTTPPQTYTVTVTKSGSGLGTVTPNGLTGNANQVVTLTETPAPAANYTIYSFTGWSGVPECANTTATTCTFTLKSNVTINAAFVAAVVDPTDTQKPVVTAFSIPGTSSSLTVPVTALTATDNIAVTGYMVNEASLSPSVTASGWSTTAPASYTFTSQGTKTLYAWAKDAAGNVSVSKASVVTVTLPVTATAFPVRLSSNSRYLVDANNTPFPILGRTAWFSISLPDTGSSSYKTYMDDAVAKGYNSIEMHVLDHDPRGNNEPYAGNGALPFLKTLNGSTWNGSLVYGSATSTLAPDYTTPNPAFWSYVDAYLAYAESKGILVFFFPSYTGYGGGNQGYMQEMTANGQTKMQNYGTFLANRYANQKNLVWMVGGDYGTGALSFNTAQTAAENGFITGLHNVTGQSIFYSAEWNSQSIATDQTSFGTQMTLNGAYSWEGDVATQGRRAYSYTGGTTRPSFLLEEPYDQEGADGNSVNPHSYQPVRQYQWVGWLSTIGGFISGNGYVWPFNPGWTSHLNTPGAQDMARLNAFIKSIPWYNLVPSGLNGMPNLVTAGGGHMGNTDSGSMDYVAAAATPARDLLVAYISPAHTGSITIDMSALSKPVQARWFDPTNATYSAPITGSPFANSGTRVFTPPTANNGNNSAGQKDWVLVLN